MVNTRHVPWKYKVSTKVQVYCKEEGKNEIIHRTITLIVGGTVDSTNRGRGNVRCQSGTVNDS